MKANQTIHFTKMHGAGNDYIYVYLPENPIADLEAAAIDWSRYHFAVGSDGLITIDKSDCADFEMRIFNNDGSEAMMCGNGIRCVGKFVRDHHLTEKDEITVNTKSGIKVLRLVSDDEGIVHSARVDMGEPILQNRSQIATEDGGMKGGVIGTKDMRQYRGTFVSMGNPHFVIFVDDISQVELTAEGPQLESHPIFPERCNIEFAQLREDGSIRMRVWERGSGITMACGTGACATAVAAMLNDLTGGRRECDVEMDGGTLHIEWSEADNHVYMTGPAAVAFEGTINV